MVFVKIFVNSKCCNFTYAAVKMEQTNKNIIIAGIYYFLSLTFHNIKTLIVENFNFLKS
jgi:hypothetical protein